MFEQILVPLDGSALAERALPCAERLARLGGATLHLVRVAGPVFAAPAPPVPPADVEDFLAAQMREAEAYLERVRAGLQATGLTVHTERVAGTIAGALLDYERAAGIDLVVLCTHGWSGLERFPLGSVAERLLRHGTTPLLLVRAFGPPAVLTHAVVPLDGSARAEAALAVVEGLARQGVVRTATLLRVVHDQEEGLEAEHYLEEVTRRAHPAALSWTRQVTMGRDPAEMIIDQAGANQLVVMATHGRSGLRRWALGSVADRVARGGAAAVLLVRVPLAPAPL